MVKDHRLTGREPVEALPAYRLRVTFASLGVAVGLLGVVIAGAVLMSGGSAAAVVWLAASALVLVVAGLNVLVVMRRHRTTRDRSSKDR